MSETLEPPVYNMYGAKAVVLEAVDATACNPDVVLLNGIGAGINSWGKFPEALAEDRRVVVLDVSKSVNKPFFATGMNDYRRVATRVLDYIGIDGADIIGLSWGTLLAEELALDDRDRFGKIVLAAGGSQIMIRPPSFTGLKVLLSQNRSSEILKMHRKGIYGGDVVDNPELIDQLGITRESIGPHYRRQMMASLGGYRNIARLAFSEIPTLIMGGDNDPLVRYINLQVKNGLTPSAELRKVKGGGHIFLLTRPDESKKTATEFLDRGRAVRLGSTALEIAA